MSDGYEKVHWLLDEAWHGDRLSDDFLDGVQALTAYADGPLFALQEYCYGQPGSGATAWAAERADGASSRRSPRTRTRCC